MSCGSTACTSSNYIQMSSPLVSGRAWSWRFAFGWLDRMALVLKKRHQRRELVRLDDRMLADIGVSRPQAIEEALASLRLTAWLLP